MDEQRARIKSRRKRRLRMLAAALAFCLLVTACPDILALLSAFAEGIQSTDDVVYVSGFAGLPEEVRKQTVPVGTGASKPAKRSFRSSGWERILIYPCSSGQAEAAGTRLPIRRNRSKW